MYKERRETVSIKFYILIALIILIIIFAIVLLVPHKKKEVTEPVEMELYSKSDMEAIKKQYSETFYNNFKNLKDTAEKYFIKKADVLLDNQTITLDKLINDNHLIASLTDANGNKCDEEKSSVIYTKNSNNSNYKMVVNLTCGSEIASLITYMGKYDYCESGDVCEKQVEVKEKAEDTDEPKEPVVENDQPPEEEPTPPALTNNSEYTLYEYVLTPSDNNGKWTDWSDWSNNKEEATLYKAIDTKTETNTIEYNCPSKTEKYIIKYKEEKYISGYTKKTTKVGTKKVGGNVIAVYDTTTTPVYGTKKTPVYGTRVINAGGKCKKDESVNYYRYRVFSYSQGINYVRYSSSKNDQYLISQGYTPTGKTR